jgi:excisionase family DNA binding protein
MDEDKFRMRAALSVKEFAQRVGLSRSRCYLEMKAKNILYVKSGRRTLINFSEVEAFLQRLAECAKGKP